MFFSGRITNSYLNQTIINSTMENQKKYVDLNMQYSTQKKINNLSDDPISLTNLFNAKNNLNRIDIYNKSIDLAKAELNTSELTLGQVTDDLNRVFELTTQASNELNTTDETSAIADEIDNVLEHIINLANTTYNGKYIFSGANINTPAYAVSGSDYTYQGTKDADGYNMQVQVSNNIFMNLNENGDNIFGEYYYDTGTSTQISTGVIGHINELLDDLRSDPPNFTGIRDKIDVIKADTDDVTYYRAQYGNNISILENTADQLSQEKISTETVRSNIEDADLIEVASKMQYQEFALQASLQSSTKLLQNSLLDFLS